MQHGYKRRDGTTLLPWARGKPLAWDATVPDTYAKSHINDTMTIPRLAADQVTQQKMDKYSNTQSYSAHTHLLSSCYRNSRHMELFREID